MAERLENQSADPSWLRSVHHGQGIKNHRGAHGHIQGFGLPIQGDPHRLLAAVDQGIVQAAGLIAEKNDGRGGTSLFLILSGPPPFVQEGGQFFHRDLVRPISVGRNHRGSVFLGESEEIIDAHTNDRKVEKGAGRGPDHFRIGLVHAIIDQNDPIQASGISQSDDGPCVAWVPQLPASCVEASVLASIFALIFAYALTVAYAFVLVFASGFTMISIIAATLTKAIPSRRLIVYGSLPDYSRDSLAILADCIHDLSRADVHMNPSVISLVRQISHY